LQGEFKYTVVSLGKDRLELTYLARGNNLRYKRLTDEEVFNLSGRAKAYSK